MRGGVWSQQGEQSAGWARAPPSGHAHAVNNPHRRPGQPRPLTCGSAFIPFWNGGVPESSTAVEMSVQQTQSFSDAQKHPGVVFSALLPKCCELERGGPRLASALETGAQDPARGSPASRATRPERDAQVDGRAEEPLRSAWHQPASDREWTSYCQPQVTCRRGSLGLSLF